MSDGERIPTNLRTLMILEAVGSSDQPLTPSQIGRVIGLPKQTIHRLCNTMVSEGFLAQDAEEKGLRPGRRARLMAAGIANASRNHIARHQVLSNLSRKIGETVNFVIPDDEGMTYQDRVETDWPFRIQLPVGTHVPFHCTASGKTFLASMPRRNRKRMLESLDLKPMTTNTYVNVEALAEELDSVAEQGFALDRQEFLEDMVAIAVPVNDHAGRFHASIAVHGPHQRLTIEEAVSKKDILLEAAEQLTHTLFSV